MNKTKSRSPVSSLLSPVLRVVAAAAVCLTGFSHAYAYQLGHSRVSSAPGQALVVQVPINNLSDADAASLSVSVAALEVWQSAGLTPPVPLDSLTVTVKPGRQSNGRLVELRSSQPTDSAVVDMLLSVNTSASSAILQSSVIMAPAPKVRLAGEQITVQRGDTLIGIANQFPVQGANLYQQLWALYSANPKAFSQENMNLLKAGAALRIPDPDAVRAVDPAFAKAQYLEHVRAFRQSRGVGQGNQGIAADASAQTLQSPPEQQQGKVDQASTEPLPPANDQVRLTAATEGQQDAQIDAEAARAKAVAEELERKQALENNIQALQGAIASAAGQPAGQSSEAGSTESTSGSGSGLGSGSAADPASSASGMDSAKPAVGGEAGSTQSASTAGQSGVTATGVTSEQSGQTPDLFSRVSQWVVDNTTAAIALVLALIALILAWALRATKSAQSTQSSLDKRGAHVAAEFDQKLKEIDLSLDDKVEPDSQTQQNKG